MIASEITLRILAITDNLEVRGLLEDVVEADGHHVDVVASIDQLLDRTGWEQYSVVLLDMSTLESEADQRLWEVAKLAPGAAIILIVGGPVLDATITDLRRSAADYLLTPINPDVLRARLARIGRLRSAERGTREIERLAAIGQTIAVLTHESRNYFQECVADLEMLERRIRDRPEEHGLVEHLQKCLDRIHRLFEDVRDYAAPIKLIRESCQLPDILRDAWFRLTELRGLPDAQLHEVGDGSNLDCEIDPFRIEQVFRNLLDNSLMACPQPARITATWSETQLDRQPAVRLAIRDNGPGIPAEQSRQIFEPFFTTKSNGTGLGLAISRRIVESHGGEISVTRTTDSGAEFIVVLPRWGSIATHPAVRRIDSSF